GSTEGLTDEARARSLAIGLEGTFGERLTNGWPTGSNSRPGRGLDAPDPPWPGPRRPCPPSAGASTPLGRPFARRGEPARLPPPLAKPQPSRVEHRRRPSRHEAGSRAVPADSGA